VRYFAPLSLFKIVVIASAARQSSFLSFRPKEFTLSEVKWEVSGEIWQEPALSLIEGKLHLYMCKKGKLSN